ncbi:MAG: hypothetical protein SVX38_06155, partial [Chloroflexota bacterium]|nr:hypothetical protein [Chloroflexota bacterium]
MSVLDLSEEFKIGEALKTVVQSLQLTTLLPTILLVASVVLLFFPSPDELDNTVVGLLVFAVIILSFLLHALNMPLIRFWEGYILGDTWWAQRLRQGQQNSFDELHGTSQVCQDRVREIKIRLDELVLAAQSDDETEQKLEDWKQEWSNRQRRYRGRMEERFPPLGRPVLPTPLGNTIAAFEWYSFERYGMDPIQLWTRFVPFLSANKYAVFIRNEKMTLDFLINLLSVNVLIFLASTFKFGISGDGVAGLVTLVIVGVSPILYKSAVVAAANWGTTVKAAFDLYRHDLRTLLRLQLPVPSLKGEREMWKGVSVFFAHNDTRLFKGFDYDSPSSPQIDNQSESVA